MVENKTLWCKNRLKQPDQKCRHINKLKFPRHPVVTVWRWDASLKAKQIITTQLFDSPDFKGLNWESVHMVMVTPEHKPICSLANIYTITFAGWRGIPSKVVSCELSLCPGCTTALSFSLRIVQQIIELAHNISVFFPWLCVGFALTHKAVLPDSKLQRTIFSSQTENPTIFLIASCAWIFCHFVGSHHISALPLPTTSCIKLATLFSSNDGIAGGERDQLSWVSDSRW